MAKILAALAVLLLALHAARADDATAAEASNMQIIGHSDLNGAGKGGEQVVPRDRRRVVRSRNVIECHFRRRGIDRVFEWRMFTLGAIRGPWRDAQVFAIATVARVENGAPDEVGGESAGQHHDENREALPHGAGAVRQRERLGNLSIR